MPSGHVPTYYGGLQMDASFEEAYGSDVLAYRGGHANVWPRDDQLWSASGDTRCAATRRGRRLRPPAV